MIAQLLRKVAGTIIVSALMISVAVSQDRSEVIAAYNEGAKLMQTDAPGAIKAFETAVSVAEKVGDSATDLKQKAAGVLPGLYIKVASAAVTDKKPTEEIMSSAKKAASVAEKYGTQTHKDNASKLLVQAYNILATGYFSKGDFPNALLTFDSLLFLNPNYINAIYNKSLIYIRENNADAFELTIDSYLEKVKAANDEAKIKQASTMALEFFRGNGSKANQAEKLDDALILLTKAAKYGEDKDLFYYFADVHNKKKEYDKGIEYAQKGLALEAGADEAKAKYYFQLALGQEGKGQTAEACESFKNAMFGPFAEPSKAKRTNLKCQ